MRNDITDALDFIEENIPDVYQKAIEEKDDRAGRLLHRLVQKLCNEDRDLVEEWLPEKESTTEAVISKLCTQLPE